MKKKEISKAMSSLAKFRWSKTSKKERIAHAKMMTEAAQKARKNKAKTAEKLSTA